MAVELTLKKNATEEIHVEPTTYGGHDLIDVRVYYDAGGGDFRPSKKGLSLRPELWRELLPMIEAALGEATVEEDGGE